MGGAETEHLLASILLENESSLLGQWRRRVWRSWEEAAKGGERMGGRREEERGGQCWRESLQGMPRVGTGSRWAR